MNSKKNAVKVILIIIIIALLALIAGCVVKNNQAQDSEPVSAEESLMYGDEYLGIDPRVDEELKDFGTVLVQAMDIESVKDEDGEFITDGVVTDSNVVVSVNEKTLETQMFSVLRTTELVINEGYGPDEMKNAYYFDGRDLAMYTVNTNLDLNVRDSVVLTWDTVRSTVDALGGIELDLPAGDIPYINYLLADSNHFTSGGVQMFNGEQAVQYCRYIIGDDDVSRHKRFQQVLTNAFEKAETLEAEEQTEIVELLLDTVYTNLTNQEFTELLSALSNHEVSEIYVWPSSSEGGLVSNVSEIHEYMFGQEDYDPTDTVKKLAEEISW